MPFLEFSSRLEVILWFAVCILMFVMVLMILMDKSTVESQVVHRGTQKENGEKREESGTFGTNYNLTMGLHKPKHDRWLIVDDSYRLQHDIKQRLLQDKRNSVLGHIQGAEAACEELLEVVVEYLTRNYPDSFRRCSRPGLQFGSCVDTIRCVEIVTTGEVLQLTAPFIHKTALEIAAHLAVEDLNILIKGDDGQHVLVASATCFPVGWSVIDRLGWPLHKLHGSVPLWQEKLRFSVERFLSKVTPNANLERTARFVQVTDAQTDLADILCQLAPPKHDRKPANATRIIIRNERQTFRKLPNTGAVVFAVKTSLKTLVELSPQELKSFGDEARSWPGDVARYKGLHCWGECALQYCDSVIANTPS